MHNPTNTSFPLKLAFDAWLSEAQSIVRHQSPVEELLAEHHVMASVLLAMEAEAKSLMSGRSLRPDFWADLIEFNGNFVHLCHRLKEEVHFIPAMVEHRLLDQSQVSAFHHDHGVAKDLTLSIRDGVEEGDWEKVLKLVLLYLHLLRPHMKREEQTLLCVAGTKLPSQVAEKLREAFTAVDKQALAERGRVHYVDLARRLSQACGIECNFISRNIGGTNGNLGRE